MINLPEVCLPLSCWTILPYFNIICFKWRNTWKVEICRKHTQTFLNNFTNKDFCYSRHSYNNIRRNGGPTCYTLHELKNKKAEIVCLNGEKMHHTEHKLSQQILKFGTWWKSCQWLYHIGQSNTQNMANLQTSVKMCHKTSACGGCFKEALTYTVPWLCIVHCFSDEW